MSRESKDLLVVAAIIVGAVLLAWGVCSMIGCDDGAWDPNLPDEDTETESENPCADVDCPPDECWILNGMYQFDDWDDEAYLDEGECICDVAYYACLGECNSADGCIS